MNRHWSSIPQLIAWHTLSSPHHRQQPLINPIQMKPEMPFRRHMHDLRRLSALNLSFGSVQIGLLISHSFIIMFSRTVTMEPHTTRKAICSRYFLRVDSHDKKTVGCFNLLSLSCSAICCDVRFAAILFCFCLRVLLGFVLPGRLSDHFCPCCP